ncbi:MAG: hypothetical protein HDQ88_09295 [Clostridia bacterium]|nr:hypothetical protein [Clostridia bacterium]
MSEECQYNADILTKKIEELEEECRQKSQSSLRLRISKLKDLRDESRLNARIFARRAEEQENRSA